MKYYSEDIVKGLLEQLDSHFVKYLDSMPSIEIKEPHGDLIDADELDAKVKRLVLLDYQFDALGCCGLVATAPTVLEATGGRKK